MPPQLPPTAFHVFPHEALLLRLMRHDIEVLDACPREPVHSGSTATQQALRHRAFVYFQTCTRILNVPSQQLLGTKCFFIKKSIR